VETAKEKAVHNAMQTPEQRRATTIEQFAAQPLGYLEIEG
jgi:hypothetical protein